MKLTSTKVIKDKQDLQEFKSRYHYISGNHVDRKYLETASIVRGIYNKNSELIGGYVLNSNIPHRYLSDIPKEAILQSSTPSQDDLVEGCCIWMSNELSSFKRGWVYLMTFYDYLSLGKRYMLGASIEPKVAKLQRLVFPNVLYEGPLAHAPWCCMYYGTRRHMAKLILVIIYKYWVSSFIKHRIKAFKSLFTLQSKA
ncbi:hypothetical protein H0A36_19540 [Endozoicomonas sp. SM1973]|uniref:Uncharacterized protein n=1 Tax=Spartinivicinus marinus TaxID=2994442 RepID=A0A853IKK5_9GAMM|nr:hypothetical protein [Spartinivicinus marinus]MCX4027539.1 hypothetical protein [Spartinivicinus marinus]NYZ68216.1 hypothetical protein [Spartinivicinus marinus]